MSRGAKAAHEIEPIRADLTRAFEILVTLQRPDGIGEVGLLLAEVLSRTGDRPRTLQVLDDAQAAFEKIGRDRGVERVQALRSAIEESR